MTKSELPPKSVRLASLDAAKSQVLATGKGVSDLRELLATEEAAHAVAVAEAERLYGIAHAEEILEQIQTAETNEKRHHTEHAAHCQGMRHRKREREQRGEERCAHDQIGVFTVDGHTHTVVAAHGLMVEHKGFENRAGQSSRYVAGCAITVDTPHDELDHERFDQTKSPDCPGCADAIGKMDAGEIPDTRSEYLSSQEHIAHVRAETKRKNRASNERQPDRVEP